MSEGLLVSGRYRLVRQLGAGGMGSVWLARDLNLQTEVAIKLIDPAIAESAEAIGRFQLEARAAATIRSTHVVQILDHGVENDRPYIAMELLKGENLGQRLEREGCLSPVTTAFILGQVGRALSLAHASGIVHRDLKPDNVFLVKEGDDEITKVLDFGIARRIEGLNDPSRSKTRTGAMLGTPYYMSPEQATGQSVDHLTDIWSFGVIAFECLTGHRAFEGESIGALFHAICMLPPPVPSHYVGVPVGFDEWFARATARDQSQRFSTIKEAAERLRLVCGCSSAYTPLSLLSSSANSTLLSGDNSMTTTGMAAVAAGTGKRSRLATTIGRAGRRPILSVVVAVSVVALLVLTFARLKREKSVVIPPRVAVLAASPMPSDGFSPEPSASATRASTAAPSPTSTAPGVASNTPETLLPKAKAAGQAASRDVRKAPKEKPSSSSQKSKVRAFNRDDNAAGI